MSLRTDLADALRAGVPDKWEVRAYSKYPANPRYPFLIVQQKAIRPTPGYAQTYRDTDFAVNLMIPETDPVKVEELVEEHAKTVMDLLDSIDFPGLIWAQGERAVWDDKFHGYSFTLTITHSKDA